ncbi:hypothetical protein B0H14DRAFT_3422557 [Mycena olivaceomarginata]|nr:hypothetical protein B0H14DRAFT_3422557 [Mycena olivaceomarginata]
MSSSTTATDTSTASGTPSLPPSNSQLASGTNYFFGFLIAFIAFLFVFLSLGLLARRRRMRLMHDFLLYGESDHLPTISQTEPLMWQPTYIAGDGRLWSDIMPLSTSLVQREVIDDKTPAEDAPRPSRKPWRMNTRRKGPQKIQVTEAMDIAVMIELPQAPDALEKAEGIHEYQIGMLRVPWKDENLPET